MDTNTPFSKVVKHLFRHLHEPRALRRNPLVRHIFDDISVVRSEDPETAAVARLHDLVRRGAERCRDADLRRGKRERALRQYAIIVRQCLERRPIREVAAELGISYYHCYRERANICRRVVQFVAEDAATTLDYFAELDEFQSLADRAAREGALGDVDIAVRHYDALIAASASTEQKVEALCRKCIGYLGFGNRNKAEAIFSAAKSLCLRSTDCTSALNSPTDIWVSVTASKFAQYQGDLHAAVSLSQRAKIGLEPYLEQGRPYFTELYVSALCEIGSALWNLGDRDRAYECIEDAAEYSSRGRAVDAITSSQVTVTLWKYRGRLLMSSKAWRPAWERKNGLTTAFEQAYGSGALVQAIDALGAITELNALAGHRADAVRAAGLAVSLAQQHSNERLGDQVSIDVATKLMQSAYWKESLSFFPDFNRVGRCEAFFRANASYFIAARALRFHNFQEALRLSTINDDFATYSDVRLRKALVQAAARYELGLRQRANAMLDELIANAEVLGAVSILRDCYALGARFSPNSRYRDRASELSRLFVN